MFKSQDKVYLEPPTFKGKSCILEIAKKKSEKKRIVPFFLGVINVGTIHSKSFLRF